MRKFICLLLLLTVLLVGCQPSTPTAVALPAASLPAPTLPALEMKPCSTGAGYVPAECGVLTVLENRADPRGRTLRLNLIVVRAQGHNPVPDPLFYVPGGPGDAATSSGITLNVTGILRKINLTRDVVFLDQRGTNGDHRLTCEPLTVRWSDATQQQVDDYLKACLAKLDGDPRFYTTAAAMQDLDDARAALGYDKINLYGISYGVTAIQVYMRMFPEHFRAAVLDHGTALDLPFIPNMPRASQMALETVFALCEQDAKCGAAYPDLKGDWQKILDRLSKGPVTVNYTPPGETEPAQVTMEGVVTGAHELMFTVGNNALLPSAVHAYATLDDWTEVALKMSQNIASGGGDNRLLLMKNVIFCFEPAWHFDPDEIAQVSAGSYYLDQEIATAKNEQKICAALPKPDSSLIYPAGKPAPLSALIINSRTDPQNPPSNMDLALKEFTKSRQIIEPAASHDNGPSGCRWDLIAEYIEKGTADGLDATCLENELPKWVISEE